VIEGGVTSPVWIVTSLLAALSAVQEWWTAVTMKV
jgi:hypothetical protein